LFFFGMTPSGSFGVWDVGRGEMVHKEVGAFGEGSHYAREFLDLPDGTVLVCVTGPDVLFARYDPGTRRMTEWVKPAALASASQIVGLHLVGEELVMRDFPGEELVFLDWRDLSLRRRVAAPGRVVKVLGGRRVLTMDPREGTLFEVQGEGWRKLGVPAPLEGGDFVGVDERTIAGITEDGTFFRFDLETGETFSRVLPTEESNGMYATALATDGRGTAYIASYINQHLIRMDLASGGSEDLGRVSVHIGQMTAMRWLGGKLYSAFYTKAGLVCFDPSRPWKLLENPRLLGLAGEEQNRPLGRLEYDGRHLYVATVAHYGDLGGAIVRLDPASG
jgi:hypothetical protein